MTLSVQRERAATALMHSGRGGHERRASRENRVSDVSGAMGRRTGATAVRVHSTASYTFPDINVDRYNIGGKYTQTFIASREIDESKITDTWVNKNLKYTHGYGATLSRVDKVTDNGQPDLLLKNIPPETDEKEIKIKRPAVDRKSVV